MIAMKLYYIIILYIISHIRQYFDKVFISNQKITRNSTIGIIGTGLSGCIMAWNLKKCGFNPVIIEESDTMGDIFNTYSDTDGTYLMNNYIWPKHNYDHYRELLDNFNIRRQNIDGSFYITNSDGRDFMHGLDSVLSEKYREELVQWTRMVQFFNIYNKSLNNNRQYNPLNIIPIAFATLLYKCDNPLFINDIIQPLYYNYPNILNYPIAILNDINDIIPIDNTKHPEYETFMDIHDSKKIFDDCLTNIDVHKGVNIVSISYTDKKWMVKMVDDREFIFDAIVYNCDIDTILRFNSTYFDSQLLGMLTYNKSVPIYLHRDKEILKGKSDKYMVYVNNGLVTHNLNFWDNGLYLTIGDKDKPNNIIKKIVSPKRLSINIYNSHLVTLLQKNQGYNNIYYAGNLNLLYNRTDINIDVLTGIQLSIMLGCDYPFHNLLR